MRIFLQSAFVLVILAAPAFAAPDATAPDSAAPSAVVAATSEALPAANAPAADAAASVDPITFFDSSSFDKDLSDELAKHPSLAEVTPSGPFSPNQIPPRLEKWLSVVSKSGGAVKLKKADQAVATRGFLSDIIDLQVKSHEDAAQAAMYARVKGYDALLTYNGNDVTSVQFVKRPEQASK